MNQHQEFEKNWWGNCCNSFGEEYKQIAYAKRMGLKFFHDGKSPFNIDMQGKSVLDIGGGPVSLLLKCVNVRGTVLDPCDYPSWTWQRYKEAGISVLKGRGEDEYNFQISSSDSDDITKHSKAWRLFDECLIYNVLQHTEDPAKVIENARRCSKIIRLFEWIDCGTSEGHPHELTEAKLNEWLKGEGKVEFIDENTARGKAYWGIFPTELYEKI